MGQLTGRYVTNEHLPDVAFDMRSLGAMSFSIIVCATLACRRAQSATATVSPPLTRTCPLDTAPPPLRIDAGPPHEISGILVQASSSSRRSRLCHR